MVFEKEAEFVPLSMIMAAFPSGWASARSWPSTCGGMYFSNRASFTGYNFGAGKVFQASRRFTVSSIAEGAMVESAEGAVVKAVEEGIGKGVAMMEL